MNNIDQLYKKNRFFYTIVGLLGLSFVIVIHEFGHFLFAKLFGITTPVFSIGFGPPLIQIPIGDTLFQIALLPLGGYVEMNPAELDALSYIPKIIVVLAGIFFNFLFTYIVLLTFIMKKSEKIVPEIEKIAPNSPAENANLQICDKIVAINNLPINENINALLQKINRSSGKEIDLSIERENVIHNISVTLDSHHPILGPDNGWLGVELKKVPIKSLTLWQALKSGKHELIGTLKDINLAAISIIDNRRGIIGPIGIITLIGKSLAINPQFFFMVLAIISINVGIFNLLPIPILDGGKALVYTIETLVGPIPDRILWYITIIFLMIFFFLLLSISSQNIKSSQKNK